MGNFYVSTMNKSLTSRIRIGKTISFFLQRLSLRSFLFANILFLFTTLLPNLVLGQVCGTNTYGGNGTFTWTAPAGVTTVTVQAWGGGGSGSQGGLNADGG